MPYWRKSPAETPPSAENRPTPTGDGERTPLGKGRPFVERRPVDYPLWLGLAFSSPLWALIALAIWVIFFL